MTLVEACAMGVPVIASNLGGRGEIVKDNLSGLLFDLGERHSFISAVEKLHNNSDLRDRLSCGARRVYKENFTPEKNVELLNSIYRQAIESRANML